MQVRDHGPLGEGTRRNEAMIDRWTRTLLAVIALSTLTLAVRSLQDAMPVARAQSRPPQEKCVWTYIVDTGKPDIGSDGKVELRGENWKKLSEAGWKVKAMEGAFYLFERCE